jgi:hypothetical protein
MVLASVQIPANILLMIDTNIRLVCITSSVKNQFKNRKGQVTLNHLSMMETAVNIDNDEYKMQMEKVSKSWRKASLEV